jgi:hypothetical protein
MKWSNSAYIELDKEIHSVGIEQNCRYTMFQFKLYPSIYCTSQYWIQDCNNGHFLLFFYNNTTQNYISLFGNTTEREVLNDRV